MSRRSPFIQISPLVGCSKPAIRRSKRGFAGAAFAEKSEEFACGDFERDVLQDFARAETFGDDADFEQRRGRAALADGGGMADRLASLRGFYLIPDFDVLGAARHVLPEIDALHVGVGIVEMERFSSRRRS